MIGGMLNLLSNHVGEGGDALLADAVWRGNARPASGTELQNALMAARRNQVEGKLARAYPLQLASTLDEVSSANQLFLRNVGQVADRLRAAGIPAVLIKADLSGDYVYANFDLVVREQQWDSARAALCGWYVHRSSYWLERSTKVLLEPPAGPAAHLHKAVSWFGIPVVPTERLLERAAPDGPGALLVPCPAEQLRIWLAHGLFQNLTLDMSELFSLRDLIAPEVTAEAQREAAREGWPAAFSQALAAAAHTIDQLDSGIPVRLPAPLPFKASLQVAAEHTAYLLRQRRARTAFRDAALRLPLVAAKKRRMLAQ
jgi:hypothetical protein